MTHRSTPPFSMDLWQRLQHETRDILLYGMGNGADKLLTVMEERHIPVAGIFASDGFVRGHTFHGMRVQSYSEVCDKYPPDGCVVLLAFGSSRPEVLALFDTVAARYPLFVPDLPVCGSTLFDAAFYTEHKIEFDRARALLCDESSRTLFDEILACKYTGEYALFSHAVSERDAWDYLAAHPITRMADLGAYNGDSAREAITKAQMRFILCAEPDRRNFRKLSEWARTVQDCEIECHSVAICDKCGEAAFDSSGNRNAGLCTGREGSTVATDSLDGLLAGRAVDYIKFDVEGAEEMALRGAEQTIKAHTPALRIALYHRPADLFALPLQLTAISSKYDLFLTRLQGCPAWDIDLVALPRT